MKTNKDFFSSEELGLPAHDEAFMARFESNLSLEKRPVLLEPRSLGWSDWISALGLAALGSVAVHLFWPTLAKMGGQGIELPSGLHLSLTGAAALVIAVAGGAYLVYEEIWQED